MSFPPSSTHHIGFLMDRTPVDCGAIRSFRERYRLPDRCRTIRLRRRARRETRRVGRSQRRELAPPNRERARPAAQGDHPVTQVSWYDADRFCRAYGTRLPTELEWERAARMGQTPDGHVFKPGDPIELSGHYLMNAWEGTFPLLNTGADGYRTTSPVGAFGVAPSGLTDMAGNVWEWTSSWYLPYDTSVHEPGDGRGERVSRGGSFLCSAQFCQGYRASARNHTTPDTSLENVGFRCVADPRLMTALAGRVIPSPTHVGMVSSIRATNGAIVP